MDDGMKACPECAEEVKAAAKLCRFCGHRFVRENGFAVVDASNVTLKDDEITAKAKANRPMYGVIVGLVLVAIVMAGVSEDQKATAIQQQIAESGPKLIPITNESKDQRRKGLHCLDGADGSNLAVVEAVKAQLVDPDSFQHIETTIYPAKMLNHRLVMQFRSRNSFNGMVRGKAVANVSQLDCRASLESVS